MGWRTTRVCVVGLLLLVLVRGPARAQAPTGTIVGIVTDSSGAPVPAAVVAVIHRDTRHERKLDTSVDGTYLVPGLAAGSYVVSVEAPGFKRAERPTTVDAGSTTSANVVLEIGEVRETITVEGVQPLLRRDDHQVSGIVTREQIENLPLNGRNFLELAKLEPGVTNPARAAFNRTVVASLGAGLNTIPRVGYTRTTVDGGSIGSVGGAIGSALQVSQEVVQEFQMSTVNFDVSTGLTTNGAINVVTRSGGSETHGNGYFFYRNHNLSAYPGLSRRSTQS
jgi:Carboxypeptidase regulatory-like domain